MSGVVVKKASSPALLLVLVFVVLVIPAALWFIGTYEPVKLGVVQEQVLGFLHGGIAAEDVQTRVDSCIEVQNRDGRWAVRRTTRIVIFADGASMSTTISEPPERSPQCQ